MASPRPAHGAFTRQPRAEGQVRIPHPDRVVTARFDIEQKKNVWPWIIGLVSLALVVRGVIALLDNDHAEVVAATRTALDGAVVAARVIDPAAIARVETG